MWYLNENKLLHNTKQSWYNTSELLLRMTESIYSSFDNNGISYTVKIYWWLNSFIKDRIGQVVLNRINFSERKFEFGVPFTPSITFKNKRKYPKMKLKLDGKDIEETDQIFIIFVDQQMTFLQYINYIYGKASKKLGYLTFLCSYKGIRPSLSV
ncbi:hypothetical protein RFI_21848 [Reticulomyxa filosa]|uniref:Uncharacterized protein n=1 Tax=Reticulomyxa filosa TaxID=46433 RepID=X6MQ09_RETFI|nr:hypothetical protein RFI_21848 [Reticulomyxa filosa]|eukprot:ETO15517.1 hypothetical protein RFI_21848 [Reticulomyxa filosa]